MNRIPNFVLISILTSVAAIAQNVRFETEVGDIVIEVFSNKAPKTAANFLRYVDGGFFNGGSFYRTVRKEEDPRSDAPIDVIQAGIHPWKEREAFPPIPLERTNVTGVQHKSGTISMGRTSPDSARGSFFICIGDLPVLDYAGKRHVDGQGFAAFGRVIEGMDVVRRIHGMRAEGQAIMPPVRILKVARVP